MNPPDSARKQLKPCPSNDSSPTKSVSSHLTDSQGSTSLSSPSKQEKNKEKLEVSSSIEKFLKERVAREVFTTQGRIAVLFIWIIGILIAANGCARVEIDFKLRFFLKPYSAVYKFFEIND